MHSLPVRVVYAHGEKKYNYGKWFFGFILLQFYYSINTAVKALTIPVTDGLKTPQSHTEK
jgi:hypothetical protein